MVKLADTSRLGAWFRSKSGFRPSLADKVEKYFSPGQRKEIHSLVSLPFGTSNNESEEYQDEPFGVINIHSNRKDILKGEGVKLFFPLTIPFRTMLAELFKKL
jgi:hypothetical protein